jgi:hypothetical protein
MVGTAFDWLPREPSRRVWAVARLLDDGFIDDAQAMWLLSLASDGPASCPPPADEEAHARAA